MEKLRKPFFAGSFYPEEKEDLELFTDSLLLKSPYIGEKGVKGVIVPHAGYRYSGDISALAFRQLEKYQEKLMRIFIIAPCHKEDIEVSIPDYTHYNTPLGNIEIDQEIIQELPFEKRTSPHEKEHAVEVQIPFLQKIIKDFKIIPILVNTKNTNYVTSILKKYYKQDDILFVFSADLSHFLEEQEARQIDKNSIEIICGQNLEKSDRIVSCGESVIKIALELANKIKFISYTNSSEKGGAKDSVVGYASFLLF